MQRAMLLLLPPASAGPACVQVSSPARIPQCREGHAHWGLQDCYQET